MTRLANKAQAKVTALEKVDKFKELPVGDTNTHTHTHTHTKRERDSETERELHS